MLLAEAFPAGLDLNDLVLLDHGLLHSATLAAPRVRILPTDPGRRVRVRMKRRTIEQGLEVMIRAGLAEMSAGQAGIRFVASERAYGFVNSSPPDTPQHSFPRNMGDRSLRDLSETSLRSESSGFSTSGPKNSNRSTALARTAVDMSGLILTHLTLLGLASNPPASNSVPAQP